MKTVKPQKVAVMTRPFLSNGRPYLAVGAMLYVPMPPGEGMLTEVSLWKMAAEEVPDAILDLGMPRSRGEWWVAGRACAPEGQTTSAVQVRAKVGASREKVLRVTGDRYWDPATGAVSAVQPFSAMPIDWKHAYGGPAYKLNPVGKGHGASAERAGEVQWLPNVESPDAIVRTPRDTPAPAGFLQYDIAWPQRAERAGRIYDEAWLKTLFPGPSVDFDWLMFNGAPQDQWVDAFFRGDETYQFEGMHPRRPVIEGQLPPLRARAFVTVKTPEGERFQEVPLRLEALLFVPHRERVVMTFRGTLEVTEDDASDVVHLVLAAERNDSPRPESHYRDVLARRLDPERGAIESLRDSDLLPTGSELRPVELAQEDQDDTTALLRTEGLLQQNLRRRHAREAERIRQQLRESGIDPDTTFQPELFAVPEPQMPDMDNLPETIERQLEDMKVQEAEIAKRRAALEEQARELCERAGIRLEDLDAKAKQGRTGPPRRTNRMLVTELHAAAREANDGRPVPEIEAMLNDPDFNASLDIQDRQAMEMYRQSVHLADPASRLIGDEQRVARESVAGAGTRDFRSRDLTGADLSQLDLQGADFTDALLESVSFAGSDLTGARFDGAVLAHADLRGAKAENARFAKANLGASDLTGANLTGADLTEAVLARATLQEAILVGATLRHVNSMEAKFQRADLRRAVARELMFMELDLTGVKLAGADLSDALFYKCRGADVSFAEATMAKASLVECALERPDFRGAQLENLRVVMECALPGAIFIDAKMETASLRDAKLADADFSRAQARAIDLSGADLTRARFYRTFVREGRFVRATLTDAVMISVDALDALFTGADLTRADFTGANLHGVDFARVKPGTKSLADALLTRARMYPQRRTP